MSGRDSRRTSRSMTPDQLRTLFQSLDRDGDGMLCFEELQKFEGAPKQLLDEIKEHDSGVTFVQFVSIVEGLGVKQRGGAIDRAKSPGSLNSLYWTRRPIVAPGDSRRTSVLNTQLSQSSLGQQSLIDEIDRDKNSNKFRRQSISYSKDDNKQRNSLLPGRRFTEGSPDAVMQQLRDQVDILENENRSLKQKIKDSRRTAERMEKDFVNANNRLRLQQSILENRIAEMEEKVDFNQEKMNGAVTGSMLKSSPFANSLLSLSEEQPIPADRRVDTAHVPEGLQLSVDALRVQVVGALSKMEEKLSKLWRRLESRVPQSDKKQLPTGSINQNDIPRLNSAGDLLSEISTTGNLLSEMRGFELRKYELGSQGSCCSCCSPSAELILEADSVILTGFFSGGVGRKIVRYEDLGVVEEIKSYSCCFCCEREGVIVSGLTEKRKPIYVDISRDSGAYTPGAPERDLLLSSNAVSAIASELRARIRDSKNSTKRDLANLNRKLDAALEMLPAIAEITHERKLTVEQKAQPTMQ